MADFTQILAKLYTISIVIFTVVILELVILARSVTGILHGGNKNKPINTKQYLKIIEEKNPSTQYKRSGLRSADHYSSECAICLSLFEEGESVRKLKYCDHVFHRDCLDRWLQRDSASCPLCRAKVLPEDVMVKYREFLNQERSRGNEDEFIFLMSAFHGNFLRGFL